MQDTPPQQASPHLRRILWSIALSYAGIGLVMMLIASPKVPYADTWRFLTTFLEKPFPENMLGADNGHREILPNLVRLAELEWLDANQWLQVLVGTLLAVITFVWLLRITKAANPTERAASVAAIAIGLFWLGNSRKLAHGSETVHLFPVILCLIAGLRALLGDSARRGWHAGASGLLASLSFGSGAACFAAYLLVLWMRRESWQRYAQVLFLAAIGAIAVMAGNHGTVPSKEIEILAHVDQLLRWLGAPFVWVLSPLLDQAHAQRLPFSPVRVLLEPIAAGAESTFGAARMHRWPGAAFGILGVCWLAWQTLRIRLQRTAPDVRTFALGLAWFGFGVGLLVVIARCGFFLGHPDQIVAQRYLPWSMLMWLGLLLTHVHGSVRNARRKGIAVLLVAVLFAPSQVWTGRYAFRRQTVAEQTAVATGVGVLSIDYWTVESVPAELRRAAPVLRAANKSVWAWPEVQMLGQPAPVPIHAVPVTDLTVTPIVNLYPGEGCDVQFRAEAAHDLLLLIDEHGTVRGLAMPDVTPGAWLGWLRGTTDATQVRVAAF